MANASLDLNVYLLVFVCVFLAATIKVDPKPMASWHGICKELEACLKPCKVLWGWGGVQATPPSLLPYTRYRVPGHSGRGYARPSEHDL